MASPSHGLRYLSAACMILCGVSCTGTAPPATAEVPPKSSPSDPRRAHRLHQFEQAGFRPLSEATEHGREVRRAAFQPSYVIKGVELELRSDGSVMLRLVSPYVVPDPVMLPEGTWPRLVAMEAEVFRPTTLPRVTRNPSEPPAPPRPPSRPPPICHGFSAFIAATGARGERFAFADTCNPGTPQLRYADEIARIAVETRPDCRFDESEALISFAACFVRWPVDEATPQK